MKNRRPTLDQIRMWPAAVNVEDAALALGVSRSGLYAALRHGSVDIQVILVGHRKKVLTASLIAVLEGHAPAAEVA